MEKTGIQSAQDRSPERVRQRAGGPAVQRERVQLDRCLLHSRREMPRAARQNDLLAVLALNEHRAVLPREGPKG